METKVTIHDAMTPNVKTINADASVSDASKIMTGYKIGSLIVGNNSVLKGIITESDIIRKVVSNNLKAAEVKVKEVMTTGLITIEISKDLDEAARVMAKNSIRRLPVIKDGKLAGIITSRDVIALSPEYSTILIENARIQPTLEYENDLEEGECERCGNFADLIEINGKFLCEKCREDIGEEEL